MSLQDKRSDSNMEPYSMNTMEELRQQLIGLQSTNIKLLLENQALEDVQREQTSKLKKMDSMLIMKEAVDRERDKVIHTFQSENTALVDKNVELRAKLITAQIQILNCMTAFNRNKELESLVETSDLKLNTLEDQLGSQKVEKETCLRRIKELGSLVETSDLKVNSLEDQLRSEKVEKETCLQKIKELNSLVEATEKKWLNVQEDLQKNVELRAKLSTAQTQIRDGETAFNRKFDYIEGLALQFSVCSERNKELESLVETSDFQLNTLEDQLGSEKVEKETCLRRIKELGSLVETSDLKVNTLEDQLRSEKVEKETCLQKIKELNSLVEATEKKWLNVQEDLQKNVELRAKLSTAQTQIRDGKTAFNRKVDYIEGLALQFSVCSERNKELESLVETSDLKVNSLEDQLRSEKVEKETCLRRTKELESLVEATKKKWLNVQEDSQQKVQKMEEDIKSLIVKSIKLQELALMSDSDKARRSEENRQREMKLLKDREKQEKEKQQKIRKELLHQWFLTFSQ
ncbi:unnamed protein product [Pleuronectes platessa]|uniref:Uncharacterized protein n=1 Tax=Pleuronectes platessa TaxID=8262 RepID=A0A9N7UIE2_PLEPL|nr:unnamed protein product [Pleuronectes platessa]